LIIGLLFIVLLTIALCVCIFIVNTDSDSSVHVKSETELRNAVNNAPYSESVVITFNSDISLIGGTLRIPVGKNITLASDNDGEFLKLISNTNHDTITVEGTLILDGIVVTHTSDASGRGVCILSDGELYLYSGIICGNTATHLDGAGVCNSRGTFIMFGGEISNNIAGEIGGGVSNGGVFTMYGGVILNNTADSMGGGVYSNFGDSEFNWFGGDIYDNTANVGRNMYP
jgi:hypothetical protein